MRFTTKVYTFGVFVSLLILTAHVWNSAASSPVFAFNIRQKETSLKKQIPVDVHGLRGDLYGFMLAETHRSRTYR